MAYSPYSESATEFVERNQGCSKWDLASHLTHNPRRSPSHQYYLVNTQIRLGNLVAVHEGNRYALYTPAYYAREIVSEQKSQELMTTR